MSANIRIFRHMMQVGLTGGIGSGKTTVAKIFGHLGIPVFYADEASKKITDTNQDVKNALVAAFGTGIYTENTLNRSALANIIFNDSSAIEIVNKTIHPAVFQAFQVWKNQQTAPYVLQEAAILFETGGYKNFDKNILVFAPEDARIARVVQRNNVSADEVKQRMAKQGDQEQHKALADFVILNYGQHILLKQVLAVHKSLLQAANALKK